MPSKQQVALTSLERLLRTAKRKGDGDVQVKSYMRTMRDEGFTSEEAVELLDEMIRDRRVVLTSRYRLRRP